MHCGKNVPGCSHTHHLDDSFISAVRGILTQVTYKKCPVSWFCQLLPSHLGEKELLLKAFSFSYSTTEYRQKARKLL